MNDLISRQAAIDTLKMNIDMIPFIRAKQYVREALDTVLKRLEELPSIGPGEGAVWYKPTGMMPPEFTGQYRCSNCGELAMRDWKHHRQTLTNFCPNCGKPMRKEGGNEQN